MASINQLTVRQIESAKPGKTKRYIPDGGGLWLRIQPSGAKVWVSRVKHNSRITEKAHGAYPGISLAEARKSHGEYQIEVRTGKLAELVTFEAMFERWLAHYGKTPSARTKRLPDHTTLKKHRDRTSRHLPEWASLPITALTRGKCVSLLDDLKGREEARQIFNMLRVFFDWCVLRGIIDASPLLGVRPGDIGLSQSRPSGRAMSMEELRLVWDMADGVSGQALRAIIITGMRPNEIAGMRWAEIDGDWWNIPAERMKSRKLHSVFIKPAMALINELHGLDSDYVFATGESKRIRRDTLTTYARRLSGSLKMAHFSPHDLRRSAATHWGELLGAAPHIVELMLSHAPQDKLQAVYQRGRYVEQQCLLWHRWSLQFFNKGEDVGAVVTDAACTESNGANQSLRLQLVKSG